MKNKKGFTLMELLLALMIAGTLIGIIMSLYSSIKGADMRMSNKRLLLGEASDLMDKIHEAALNYTIDYEEYFNRSTLGFGPGNTGFTTYGNAGEWYYCGTGGISWNSVNNDIHTKFINNKIFNEYKIFKGTDTGCVQTGYQKYGEYGFQQRRLATGNLNSSLNANSNTRRGPVAINPNTGLDYLYLISPDGTERYYFRRVLRENKGEGINDKLYVVQMLKLKGHDVGKELDCDSWGAYDGFIDARVCDFSQGYKCTGLPIGGVNPDQKCNENNGLGNNLPASGDDGWEDITSDKVTVRDMKIDIYPNKDPYLVGNETGLVYDPYAKISFTMNLYGKRANDEITMTTTLSFKNSYTRFSQIQYTGYIPDEAY